MKEIKYKSLYRGKWYIVQELNMYPDGSIGVGKFQEESFSPDHDHIKCILPYTGRKDKNGVFIYEGDKVLVKGRKRIGEYETEIVYHKHGGFTLKVNDTYFVDDSCIMATIKVTGNIYE